MYCRTIEVSSSFQNPFVVYMLSCIISKIFIVLNNKYLLKQETFLEYILMFFLKIFF